MKNLCTTASFAVILTVGSAMAQESSFNERAARLAALRTEVESFDKDIESERELQLSRLQALQAQIQEMNILIQREHTRLVALSRTRDELIAKRAEDNEAVSSLVAPLKAGISALIDIAETGIPFVKESRLGDLKTLEDGLDGGRISAQVAASRLWQMYEDEMIMTRTTRLHSQMIELDGRRQQVDVARVGMIGLYFRTVDQEVGRARVKDGAWMFEKSVGETERVKILALFDALEQRLTQGHFTLPLDTVTRTRNIQ